MNFIKLLETIKEQINFETFGMLQTDFFNQFQDEYKNIKPCKSTQEKAIQRYISKAKYKDEKTPGAYTNGHTALILSADRPECEKDIRKTNVAEKLLEMFKGKRPTDCYFFDSIALYKTLKKQEKQDYFLKIDDRFYNAAYVAEMLDCIADNKNSHITAEICENGALLIRQRTAAALILPIMRTACSPDKNANMQDFLRYLDSIEKGYIEEIRKTA